MKALEKKQAEARKIYEIYWDSYNKGDLESFASLLDEDFEMVGTSEREIAHSKSEGIEFYKAQMAEVVGKVEMRNRSISAKPLDGMVLINENCDIYVLGEPDWRFYSKIRISTLLHETASGWKVIQQHGSLPDMRVQEGETLALEKITKENLELRDAVKRRTIELENKNRELEIEAALERVRAIAIGMKKPEDMLAICRIISEKLEQFGVTQIRNIQTAIIDEGKGIYLCYQYFTPYDKEAVERTEYLKSPVEHGMVSQMLASKDGHFSGTLEGKELGEFREHRKAENHFPDPLLDKAIELSYCFLSIGQGGLGLTLYQRLDTITISLFQRFHQVFSLAYQRFRDIEKAEAQAREAEIELALERVRARTMAMQNSAELPEAANVLFQQVQSLGMPAWSAGYCIWSEDLSTGMADKSTVTLWMSSEGVIQPPFTAPTTEDWLFSQMRVGSEAGKSLHVVELGGDELVTHYQYMRTLPVVGEILDSIIAAGHPLPAFQIMHQAYFSKGFLLFITYQPVPEAHDIFIRFAKVFDQTYTRFLDLQKAEAQAREAQIEAALERVRSRTMAMHTTAEMKDLVSVVIKELIGLGFDLDLANFNYLSSPKEWLLWMATPEYIYPELLRIPAFHHPLFDRPLEAFKKGLDFMSDVLTEEEFKAAFTHFYNTSKLNQWDDLQRKRYVSGGKGMARSVIFMKSITLTISNFKAIPYTDEQNQIVRRFAKAFEQAYTRFLDLQKAEEQAREAQIEAALERVRSRSMGMQRGEDLKGVVKELYDQLRSLGFQWGVASITIMDADTGDIDWWMEGFDDGYDLPEKYHVPNFDNKGHKQQIEHWKNGSNYAVIEITGLEKKAYDAYYFYQTDFVKAPENSKKLMMSQETVTFSMAYMKYGALSWSPPKLDENQAIVLQRFAKVFEQTYTRFLDLQKAEEQAREAQIEAALERVRSRTMAMHKSDELTEVASLLFRQIKDLGIMAWTTGFNIWAEDNNSYIDYVTDPEGNFIEPYRVDTTLAPVMKAVSEARKTGVEFFVNYEEGEEIKETYRFLMSFGEKGQYEKLLGSGFEFPSQQYEHFVFGKKVSLLFITYEPVPEAHDIFKRFAKVFEQTYTRFLDLQKAEAQAREAQIEAALERIRARAMAMHHSGELKDVLTVLFNQFDILGIKPVQAQLSLFDLENNRFTFRSTGKGGRGNMGEQVIDMDAMDTWKETIDTWKARKPKSISTIYFPKETLPQLWALFDELRNQLPEEDVITEEDFPDGVYVTEGNFNYGYIGFAHHRKATPEEEDIVIKIATEFGRSYQRFLDLQKAEAQAREAEIEVALEKVRSRSLAMHKSDELKDVVFSVFERLSELQIHTDSTNIVVYHDESEKMELWTANGKYDPTKFNLSMSFGFYANDFIEARKKENVFRLHIPFEEKNSYWKELFDTTDFRNVPEARKNFLLEKTECLIQLVAFGKVTSIMLFRYFNNPFTNAEIEITERFSKVFDQAYTRFLDLQKAEEQAREAQIQLSLERIRAKAMAMQHSDELSDFLTVVFEQFEVLNLNPVNCHLNFLDIENNRNTFRLTGKKGASLIATQEIDLDASPLWKKRKEDWKAGDPNDVDVLYVPYENHQEINEIFKELLSKLPEEDRPLPEDFPDGLYVIDGYCKNGYLGYSSSKPPTEEDKEITKRIANEFGNVYQRFLDLEKAEAQARESQIQLSLERIRAKAMAMQHSDELSDFLTVVFEQFEVLNLNPVNSQLSILDLENNRSIFRLTGKNGATLIAKQEVDLDASPVWKKKIDDWKAGHPNDVDVLYIPHHRLPEIAEIFKEILNKLPEEDRPLPEDYPDGQYIVEGYCKFGYLGFSASRAPSNEEKEITRRIATEFGNVYQRFIDLQKAEAQAKEATKQASLDRVRGVISGMRSAVDLELITPLVFNELTILGVPFIRCGVFIINENQEKVEAYLSSPEGSSLGVLRLPFQASELTFQTVEAWRKGMVYRQHWNKEDFVRWIEELMKQDQIQDSSTYQGSAAPPESLDLHFVPFTQGMLYVGSVAPLGEEEIDLVKALAKTFAIAYARYEDFVKLDKAKSDVDLALDELKATQAQLVQQEKLASLGQLTAGIAHEIKNPLNFVNNFSEVSRELIAEIKEERAKSQESRDETLVDDILEDIQSNLEKINEHGSRANSIVTSMLQHSRGGSGKMEPTDLNGLIREYSNLAFHGMRAGKNPINVEIILVLDEAIKEVDLVKEDFSRVIINLCNNAFDAMRQKFNSEFKTLNSDLYLPKLTIRAKAEMDYILIEVADNGPGIPNDIKDKILQPFFTTKKGTEGTGLGLSLSYDIVKAHGGELKVFSTEGEGSEFMIHLPLG